MNRCRLILFLDLGVPLGEYQTDRNHLLTEDKGRMRVLRQVMSNRRVQPA